MRNNPREQLLNLHRYHVKAWEQKSFDHLRDLYNDEAVIFNIVPPPRFSDFKTFENTLNQYFTQIKEVSILTSNIQIEVQGDVSWITSQYLMAYNLNGQLIRQNGRWTEIYFRNNGEWKLSHLHASPDPLEQPSSKTSKIKRMSRLQKKTWMTKPRPQKKTKTKSKAKKKVKTRKQTKKKVSKKKPTQKTSKKRTAKKRNGKKIPKKKAAVRIAKKRTVKEKVAKKVSTRKKTGNKAIGKRPARKKSAPKSSKKSSAKRARKK